MIKLGHTNNKKKKTHCFETNIMFAFVESKTE